MAIPTPVILDISEWQTPATINYDKMAKALDGVIVRIQYGSNYVDNITKRTLRNFKNAVFLLRFMRGFVDQACLIWKKKQLISTIGPKRIIQHFGG